MQAEKAMDLVATYVGNDRASDRRGVAADPKKHGAAGVKQAMSTKAKGITLLSFLKMKIWPFHSRIPKVLALLLPCAWMLDFKPYRVLSPITAYA